MVRGRKPIATAVKEASGALKHDPQRRNRDEPVGTLGAPTKPDMVAIDTVASEKWEHLCYLLDDLGILAISDQAVMASYCTTWSEWEKTYHHVREHGHSCPTAAGSVTTSPESHAYHKLSDRLLKLCAELGLTPSSRSRIKAPGKGVEDDPLAEWMANYSRN